MLLPFHIHIANRRSTTPTIRRYHGRAAMRAGVTGSLRAMMEPDREENRTVFMVLKDEDVERAVAAVEEVAGSFNTPNSGIAFTLPVDFVKGIQ